MKSEENPVRHVCVYHADCTDGLVAALVIHLAHPEVELIPAKYGTPPPLERMVNAAVTIVDFSYSPADLLRIKEVAALVTLLDHHETAMNAHREAFKPDPAWTCFEGIHIHTGDVKLFGAHNGNTLILFDMQESGASMAWKFTTSRLDEAEMPKLITLVRDRDLWRFEHADTEPLYYGLQAGEQTIENLAPYMDDKNLEELLEVGRGVQAYFNARVAEVLSQQEGRYTTIGAYHVPVANVPHFMASAVGNELSSRTPLTFAATYYDTETHRVYSLRSSKEGVNVGEVAKLFGGGGHAHAAGFRIALARAGSDHPFNIH